MIRVGTSGFSYDDWHGPFYPEGLARRERLGYYAERFSCVEINSSYYRQPAERTMSALAAQVAAGFRFAVKAYGGITHDWSRTTNADLAVFARGVEPLLAGGRLACVLAQFPASFRPGPEAAAHLARLRDGWSELPVTVEFRHREWATDEALAVLDELGFGFCCVDEPELPGLMPPRVDLRGRLGYLRFHGRNAERWYDHAQAWERYDYSYSSLELAEWVPRIKDLSSRADEVYVFFNNHYEAQAVHNARELMELLGGEEPDGERPG